MIIMAITGGIVLLLIVWFALTRSAPAIEYADDDYYDDDEYEAPDPVQWEIGRPLPRFVIGDWYEESDVRDLLWAMGYSRAEVQKEIDYSYVSILRSGLSAEFQWFDDGRDLWRCEAFDPTADTEVNDRWRRQPTDDERRQALWR